MPKEILEVIAALYSGQITKEQAEAIFSKPPCRQYNQHHGSYKITSADGTITPVEITSTYYAQVTRDTIHLVWPHAKLEFTTRDTQSPMTISQCEFNRLAAFVTQ